MFSVCKFDYPRGFGPKAVRCTAPPRVTRTTDIRTFRCGDYLNWESGLLPFSKPAPDDAAAAPAKTAAG
jgi:hypothetical protein